jgi:hypothetical protein
LLVITCHWLQPKSIQWILRVFCLSGARCHGGLETSFCGGSQSLEGCRRPPITTHHEPPRFHRSKHFGHGGHFETQDFSSDESGWEIMRNM